MHIEVNEIGRGFSPQERGSGNYFIASTGRSIKMVRNGLVSSLVN